MSERILRRRSDAARRATAVLDAAIAVLGDRPEASVEEIATAAGVSRQTVYAHFGSRERLLAAAVDKITSETLEAVDAAAIEDRRPRDALDRLLDASWRTFTLHQRVLEAAGPRGATDEARRHTPIAERLDQIVRRGQADGSFDPACDPRWIVDATIALGHVAGERVQAGSWSIDEASAALRTSIFRLLSAANEPPGL